MVGNPVLVLGFLRCLLGQQKLLPSVVEIVDVPRFNDSGDDVGPGPMLIGCTPRGCRHGLALAGNASQIADVVVTMQLVIEPLVESDRHLHFPNLLTVCRIKAGLINRAVSFDPGNDVTPIESVKGEGLSPTIQFASDLPTGDTVFEKDVVTRRLDR